MTCAGPHALSSLTAKIQQQSAHRRRNRGARRVLDFQPDPSRRFGAREDFRHRAAQWPYPEFEVREAVLDIGQAPRLSYLATQDFAAKRVRRS